MIMKWLTGRSWSNRRLAIGLLFCPTNVRSAIVYAYLLSKVFSDVRIVEGGYLTLTDALQPGKVFKVIQRKE